MIYLSASRSVDHKLSTKSRNNDSAENPHTNQHKRLYRGKNGVREEEVKRKRMMAVVQIPTMYRGLDRG